MPILDFDLKPPLIAEDDFGTFEEGGNSENSPSPARRRLSQYLHRLENGMTNSMMDSIVEWDDDEFDDESDSDGEEDVDQRLRTGSADKK